MISTGPEAADQRARDAEVAATKLVVGLAAAVALVLALVGFLVIGVVGAVIGLVVGAGAVVALWTTGDQRVLARLDARPLAADEAPRLHNLVDGLVATVGVASPDVLVVDDPGVNIGLVGARARTALVVTGGFSEHLDRLAMEGAIARELHRLRCGSQRRETTAAALVGWLSPGLAARLAGDQHRLDDEVVIDAEATVHTRYPPGLRSALVGAAAHPGPGRATLGVSWMIDPTEHARADVQVRIAALAER